MEIIETAPFARCCDGLFDDEQFREFEEHLVLHEDKQAVPDFRLQQESV